MDCLILSFSRSVTATWMEFFTSSLIEYQFGLPLVCGFLDAKHFFLHRFYFFSSRYRITAWNFRCFTSNNPTSTENPSLSLPMSLYIILSNWAFIGKAFIYNNNNNLYINNLWNAVHVYDKIRVSSDGIRTANIHK